MAVVVVVVAVILRVTGSLGNEDRRVGQKREGGCIMEMDCILWCVCVWLVGW